ncbi:CpsD/CapB family tyrosine-protein kinase [Camelliibacillus cellulosilyticus]|uniref:non-specific protein-tyrosine kinase n=1 Tax=Camelliibacillus cellulosilyticus TaxID=2174486 RepID=A0ABV9GR49_9BACL
MKRKRKELNSLKQRSLIAHLNPKSPISEQYRTIRTNIDFSLADRDLRTLTITSAGPAEGKSMTTANLAAVMAQQGKKVLLIDADMRKPTVHYTFRLNNTEGLTNLLTKQTVLSDVIRQTDVPNLFVITSGPIPPNPAELLGSRNMHDLLGEAMGLFDLVIFDSPPVLAVTDAQVLSSYCDGTVLVVASGQTEKEAALEAKDLLKKAKGRLLGVVLNRKPMKKGHYYYYYGQ